jgi:apolipoprotein N-acyltransferase
MSDEREKAATESGEGMDSPSGPKPRPWLLTGNAWARIAASALCGNLMWICAPDVDLWWLSFVAWIPWLWAIEGLRPRRAFAVGLIAGIFSVFIGFFWMTELLTRFAGMSIPVALLVHLLFASFQGLQWAFPAAFLAWLRKRSGRSTLLLAPLLWAGFEAVLPNIFPVYMGFIWAWQPRLIQVAEIGGALTVTLVIVAMNAALYELGRTWLREKRIDRRALIAAVGWFVGVPLYGTIRMAQVDAQMEAAPHMKIGVVQGNFGIRTYADRGFKPTLLREMQLESKRLQDEGAEMVVWGETAYPYAVFHRESQHDLSTRNRRKVQRHFDVPIIFGTITRERRRKDGERNPYPWNSALVMHENGRLGDLDSPEGERRWEKSRYDKVYPLAFGEAVPWPIDPEWYLETVPSASHLNVGDGPNALEANGYRFGPLVCYEDILPRYARKIANEEVHAFVNLTNDSWFGKTREQNEHLALAVFRSVEHRKPLIRAVNAGTSVHVDAVGRVLKQTEVTDSDVTGYQGADGFVADVAMMDPQSRTLYGRIGDGFAVFLWLGIAGLGFRKRRAA